MKLEANKVRVNGRIKESFEFNAETFPFLSIWIFIRFDKLIGEIFRKSLEIEDGVEIMIFTFSLTRRQFIIFVNITILKSEKSLFYF